MNITYHYVILKNFTELPTNSVIKYRLENKENKNKENKNKKVKTNR